MSKQELKKSINLPQAITIAIGTILGTGVLTLPGLVHFAVGSTALYSWLADTLLVIPLLFIFASLGKNNPNPGGAAGFIEQVFPNISVGFEYILLGAMVTGLSAVALTGAYYLVQALPFTFLQSNYSVALVATFFTVFVGALNINGVRNSIRFQNVVIGFLMLVLFILVFASLFHWHLHKINYSSGDYKKIWHGMGLAFFAYSGWETIASTSAEFKNPKRDFPLAIMVSFFVISLLYFSLACAVEFLSGNGNIYANATPLLLIAQVVFPGDFAGWLVTIIVLLVILANLNGVSWAASRLLFDLGQKKWCFSSLKLEVLTPNQVPKRAMLVLQVLCLFCYLLFALNLVDLKALISLAGENCALVYIMCVVSYLVLEKNFFKRLIAVFILIICTVFMGIFAWSLLFPITLFVFPYVAFRLLASRRKLTNKKL